MAKYRHVTVTAGDLSLMCVAYPVYQAKCAAIQATEHFHLAERNALGQELEVLETKHRVFMDASNKQEELLKKQIAEGERTYKIPKTPGRNPEKEAETLANLRIILVRYDNLNHKITAVSLIIFSQEERFN